MSKNLYAEKAIILARVSTEEQANEDRFSIPAQLRNMREYVQKGGKFGTLREIVEEFQIEESAFKGKRTKFSQALEIVKEYNEPVAVIFDLVDRFTRRWDEVAEYDKLRTEGKVELHFIGQNLAIYRNSQTYEIQSWEMFVMMARAFSLSISGNVKRSIKEKLAQGIFPGGLTPTGYLNQTEEMAPGVMVKMIVVDPERAPFVKQCFRLYVTGKYSLTQLTKIMVKAGFTIKTKSLRVNGKLKERPPKPVTESDLARILKEPFYTGKFYYKDPDTGQREHWDNKGTYEPLIDWTTYERVQEVLNDNNTRINGHSKNKFKFKALLTCGFCGHTLTAEEMSRSYKDKDSPQAKTVYYHCSSGKTYHDSEWYKNEFGTNHSGVRVAKKGSSKGKMVYGCPQRWWTEEEVEQFLIGWMDLINYGEEVFEGLRGILDRGYQERMELNRAKIKKAKTEYTKNEDLIKGIVRNLAIEADEVLKADFRKQYEELKPIQAQLKEEIRSHEEAMEFDTDEIVKKFTYCCNLKDQYLSLDEEGQREMVSEIFSKIIATKGWVKRANGGGTQINDGFINVLWKEPFSTLHEINFDEFFAYYEEGEKTILLKNQEVEASLFP